MIDLHLLYLTLRPFIKQYVILIGYVVVRRRRHENWILLKIGVRENFLELGAEARFFRDAFLVKSQDRRTPKWGKLAIIFLN